MQLSDFINQYTVSIAGVLGLALTIIKIVQSLRNLGNKEFVPLKGSHAPLVKHSLLTRTIPQYTQILYNMFRLGSETKTNLFRDILIHQMDAYQKFIRIQAEYIDSKCKVNCTGGTCVVTLEDLVEHNKKVLDQIISEYSGFYSIEPGYSENEKQLLHHGIALLEQSNASHISIIRHAIAAMTANAKYTSCSKVLQASVFSAYETAIHCMLYNLETSLGQANGYFKDKSYPDKYLSSKGGRFQWK